MARSKITKQFVDKAVPGEIDRLFWDTQLRGFGLKVTVAGTKTYVVQYRTSGGRHGKARRVTIGKHGSPWTAEAARQEAQRILALSAQGEDPAEKKRRPAKSLTISELCDLYLEEGIGSKKASTISTDRGRIERHIKPLLGKRKVSEIGSGDVAKFMHDVAQGKTALDIKVGPRARAIVRGGKGTATRTVGLLGGIFSYAVQVGFADANPVLGVKRYPDRKNERFLSLPEIAVVGRALESIEKTEGNKVAVAILRMLLLTGARRGEIENLKWSEVDLWTKCLRLEDSKTGQKIIHLNTTALALIDDLSKHRMPGATFVFASPSADRPYAGTSKVWQKIRSETEFADLRIHDLRHTFASLGILQGAPVAVVGKLLGHANVATTERYAHLTEDPVRLASNRIGDAIGEALKPGEK